jgi:AcrR family transcriptional regulator
MSTTDPPRADGRTARRSSTRDKVRRAAVALISERGYTDTTIDDIAEKAGVSKGSVFYNFGSKASLGADVVRTCAAAIADVVREAVVDEHGWAGLSAATLAVTKFVDRSPAEAQVVINELFRPSRPWDAERRDIRTALVAPLAAVLEEVHVERHAPGPAPAVTPEHREMVALTILGGLIVVALDRAAFSPERPIEDVHQALLQTVSGLRAERRD